MSIIKNKTRYFVSDFIEIQRKSFSHLLEKGLIEEFTKRNPITNSKKTLEIFFYPEYYKLTLPVNTPRNAILKEKSYTSKLYIPVQLTNKITKTIKLKWICIGNLPLMTKRGHFILNGSPRIIVNQILRSPGIYYQQKIFENFKTKWDYKPYTSYKRYYADLICQRGTWLRLEIDKEKALWAQMKKGPKIPLLWFLIGMGLTEKIIFNTIYQPNRLLENIEKIDPKKQKQEIFNYVKNPPEAWHEIYSLVANRSASRGTNKMDWQGNKGNLLQVKHKNSILGRKWIFNKFMNPRTYDLGKIGRLNFNKKLAPSGGGPTNYTLTPQDLLYATDYLIKVENGLKKIDDIDHLKNRRVRTSGELLQLQIGTGLIRLEKEIRQRLNSVSSSVTWNQRPLKFVPRLAQGVHMGSALTPQLNPKLIGTQSQIFPSIDFAWDNLKKESSKGVYKKGIAKFTGIAQKSEIIIGNTSLVNPLQVGTNKPHKGLKDQTTLRLKRKQPYVLPSYQQTLQSYQGAPTPQVLSPVAGRGRPSSPFTVYKPTLEVPLELGQLINTKAWNSALREFFGSSPLSQFMDQINPLSELTHKRRLTSMGPGGVSRDSATLAIRGIHPTHYGRICPVETPEGKNTGLVNSMTTLARINANGFLQSPFYLVYKGQVQKNIGMFYLSADQEEKLKTAAPDVTISYGDFLPKEEIPVKIAEDFTKLHRNKIEYVGVSPLQMISIATSLIPFLEHDDANRALMGSNMQRQAVPLVRPEKPIVGTGLEGRAVSDSGHALQAKKSGFVTYASGKKIIVHSY